MVNRKLLANAVVEWGKSNFSQYDWSYINLLAHGEADVNHNGIVSDFEEDYPDFADATDNEVMSALEDAAWDWIEENPAFDRDEVEDWYWNHCTKECYDSARDFYRENEAIASDEDDYFTDVCMDELGIDSQFADEVHDILKTEAMYNLDTCD